MTNRWEFRHYLMAVHVYTLTDAETFDERLRDFLRKQKAIEIDNGLNEILYPGEIEGQTKVQNLEESIRVNEHVFEKILTIASTYGVEPPTPQN